MKSIPRIDYKYCCLTIPCVAILETSKTLWIKKFKRLQRRERESLLISNKRSSKIYSEILLFFNMKLSNKNVSNPRKSIWKTLNHRVASLFSSDSNQENSYLTIL